VIPGDQGQAAVKIERKAEDIEKIIVAQKKASSTRVMGKWC